MDKIFCCIFIWFGFLISGQQGTVFFDDTRGNIEVNGSGQLQYTLPIALPPGIQFVAPQINLLYISGSSNGIAGYGWSVSGITAISRMGKTIEKDGDSKSVQLDYSDYYSFNGHRLLLKSGEYGKDGAEYVTEKFSNVKIKSIGNLSGSWKGPAYWEVTFEDGSQAWYGGISLHNITGQSSMDYNIVKWRDRNGNSIEYEYENNLSIFNSTQSGNVIRIKKILWGGNETLSRAHYNEMVFGYRERSVKELSYHAGKYYFQNSILEHVTVKTKGKQFKKYVFSHIKRGNTDYEFLEKITEYNADNEAANPVVFEYAHTDGNWTKEFYSSDSGSALQGDFDGDGKMDMIKYFDAFEECVEYSEDWEYYCSRYETRPAGLYLLRSTLDSQPMQRVYLHGFDLSRGDFEQRATVTLKSNSGFLGAGQGFVVYKKNHITPPSDSDNPRSFAQVGKTNIELHYYSVGEDSVTKEYIHTIPHTEYDESQGITVSYIPGTQLINTGYTRTSFSGIRGMDLNADGLSELVGEVRHENCEFVFQDTGGGNGGHDYWQRNNEQKEVSNDLAKTERPRPGIFSDHQMYDTRCSFTYSYLVVDSQGAISKVDNFTYPLTVHKSIFGNHNKHGDFDGNGKPDFITFVDGYSWLSQFKKNAHGKYILESIPFPVKGNSSLEGLLTDAQSGDFNGDGKMDLLVPLGHNTFDWLLYISTGDSFVKQYLPNFSYYKPYTYHREEGERFFRNDRYYSVQDINGDGKSDFVEIGVYTRRNIHMEHSYSQFLVVYHENIGNGNHIAFREKNIDNHNHSILSGGFAGDNGNDEYPFSYSKGRQKINRSPQAIHRVDGTSTPLYPMVGDMYINYANHQILVFSSKSLFKYSGDTFPALPRMTKIHQGGLVTEIEYKPLAHDSKFYQPEKKEQYPYVEIKNAAQSYAVATLKQYTEQGVRRQDFRYRGLIAHLHGKGMIGFRKTARTSWYTENTKNTIVWSGVETDPLLDGVPIKEWTIKSIDNAFPNDLTFSNNQLLSLKTTAYRKDMLSSGVQALVPTQTVSKNFQTQVTTENEITAYNEYYLPLQSITKVNQNFSVSTTHWEYLHNPSGVGRDYFIGRPKSKQEIITAYGDSKGAKEEYDYENHLLKSKTSYNQDNTGWVRDVYTYDGFGNILQTTKSNSVDSQTITERVEYDSDGRFVIEKIDNLGLTTKFVYNDWGQVLRQTDPFGVETTTAYDAWGKVLNITTNIGGTTQFEYHKYPNHHTKITETNSDGASTSTLRDMVGNPIRIFEKSTQGRTVMTAIVYDELGRQTMKSQPTFYTGNDFHLIPLKWNTIEYDDFSRPIKATAYTGKIVETQYNGLTTIITETNAYGRFKRQTLDPLGNIASSEDLGGVIHFTYNALGQNTKAQYGNNTVTTKYDNWGRKMEFHDPSNGTYQYLYNGFGAIIKTISPKGHKSYILNDKGQLIAQNESSNDGTSTQKTIHLEYNAKGQLTKKRGLSKGESYQTVYSYDGYGRNTSVVETHHGKTFRQDNIEYDHLSRVVSYRKSIESGNHTTSVEVENLYGDNGILHEMRDKNSGNTLWKLEEIDAEGKVLQSMLGRAMIRNSYSPNGFLTQIDHRFGSTTFAQIHYNFDSIKNELKSRVTGGDFTILEFFEYDAQNRLVNWTDPVTGNFTQHAKRNIYDAKGRITYNDALGEIHFQNTQSLYRPSSATLNAQGQQHLTNNLIQRIQYNENNDPVFIDGEKGDVAFEYGLTSMRQVMRYGGEFIPEYIPNFSLFGQGKPAPRRPFYTKYYSEDGSFEVVQDNRTGREKHIIYIGGSPYDSDIIFVKDFTESTGSYKFLHKDYLGSILAISDEAGNKVEQRHYDAWGNLTHLQLGNGEILTDKERIANSDLLIARGYTSHEHLFRVGLIHMNGRLYDPLLRRFLNADENIQDPHNTQNYNKYGYVLNNPLMYNDPSGEFFAFLGLGVLFWKAVIIGAAVGVASYTIGLAVTGNLHQWNIGGALKSAFWGAVSGAVTFGIGSIFSTSTGALTATGTAIKETIGKVGLEIIKAGTHAVAQGVMSVMQGGNFEQAFWSGALGSLGAGAFGALAGNFANSAVGTITFGAISGGIGAELSGGNFWEGAVIGGMVAGLNHAMHKIDSVSSLESDSEEFPQQTGEPIPPPEKLDSKYGVGNKTWQKVNGRWTITTKKEILQWDSKKGEIELYNKSTKAHLGGFDPANRSRQISKSQNRVPTGGWKINTGNVIKTGSKIINGIEKINRSMIIFDLFPVWMIPYQTGTIQYQPITS